MRDLTALNAARRDADLAAVAGGGLVDVLVIGGGITGAGIALDAASRGLTAVLVEKHDLAFGTSRWSSKLVHGGLRYLATGNVGIARRSAVERLPIRVLPVLQRLQRLRIDRLVRHDPQNKPGVLRQIPPHDPADPVHRQPGLSAACGHLQRDIRHRAAHAILARGKGNGGAGCRQAPSALQGLPGLRREVGHLQPKVRVRLCHRGNLLGPRLLGLQRIQISIQRVQHPRLIVERAHQSRSTR